jgi:hypothetical protein
MNLILRYSAYLDKRPFVGRVATGAFLCLFGDVITQTLIEKRSFQGLFNDNIEAKKSFDLTRCLRAGFIGLTGISLNLYGWYAKVLPFLLRRLSNNYLVKTYPFLATTLLGI